MLVEARFSAPVQTGHGAHPASCIVGTRSLSQGLSGRGMAFTTHPHLVPKLKVQLYLNSPSESAWPVLW